MTRDTPGPWEARYHLLLEEKRKLASLETLTEKQKLNLGQINSYLDRWYALREAAPAMLEALKGLLENAPIPKGVKQDFSYILYREAARKAIRLAEGRG